MRTRSMITGAMSIITGVSLSLLLPGCGEKMKEAQQAMENVKSITENAQQAQQETNEAQKRRAERRAKGDTLAIPYKDLQQYLPSSINGYTAAEPSGNSMDMAGMSYSTGTRRYTRQGANGEEAIEISLTDYNATESAYEVAAAWMALGLKADNDEQTVKTYKLDYPASGGMETYHKKDKRSELTYALGGRFILTIKADNQSSIDGVKGIATSMKLSELANK